MTERPPFNLDVLLGERDVRHYLRFIEGAGGEFIVDGLGGHVSVSVTAEPVRESSWWSDSRSLVRVGDGPDWCSSSAELAITPEICWDVCGYYAAVGVHWKATRREMQEAVMANPGWWDDRELVYALKMLLDPVIRFLYDRMGLGELFMADRRVQEEIKRRAKMQAAREGISVDEVLERAGMHMQQETGERELAKDQDQTRRQAMASPDPGPADPSVILGSSIPEWDRRWSYWTEGRSRGESGDLPAWQLMIGAEFRARGVTARFAVGLTAGPGFSVEARTSEGASIILLGTEPPSPALARKAVREIMAFQTGVTACRL